MAALPMCIRCLRKWMATNSAAFIVERGFKGFTQGPEEHKMGIKGSSTVQLYFEDCKVPAENMLGEVGKGHVIAFNILNIGRLEAYVLRH